MNTLYGYALSFPGATHSFAMRVLLPDGVGEPDPARQVTGHGSQIAGESAIGRG